jgi:HrpA-like RNA helicase
VKETTKSDGTYDKDRSVVSSSPKLRLNPAQTRALELHLRQFPPTPLELVDMQSPVIDNFASDLMEEEDAVEDGDEVLLNQGLGALQIQLEQHSPLNVDKRTQWHHEAQRLKLSKPRFREMQTARSKLPAFAYRDDICAAVRKHRVILIQGDTGCGTLCIGAWIGTPLCYVLSLILNERLLVPWRVGKSTQVVQFLLDDPWIGPTANIIVTQPRRISAISMYVFLCLCYRTVKTAWHNIILSFHYLSVLNG